MLEIKTIAAGVFAIFGIYVIALNWGAFWVTEIRKSRFVSWTPLVGAVTLSFGMWLSPYPTLHAWWWLPFILDYGSGPGIVRTALYYCRRPRPPPSNETEKYHGG